MCPWCWITSRWLLEAVPLSSLDPRGGRAGDFRAGDDSGAKGRSRWTLWDALVAMLAVPNFYELKRSRMVPPSFE
jgi:hypothetical protein